MFVASFVLLLSSTSSSSAQEMAKSYSSLASDFYWWKAYAGPRVLKAGEESAALAKKFCLLFVRQAEELLEREGPHAVDGMEVRQQHGTREPC